MLKHYKTHEIGVQKMTTKLYLVDALSGTETESKITKKMKASKPEINAVEMEDVLEFDAEVVVQAN
jgi:hypothetical protein